MAIPVYEESQLMEFLEFIARDSSVNKGEYCIRTSLGKKPLGQLEFWPPSQHVVHIYGINQDPFIARAVYRKPVTLSEDPELQLGQERMNLQGRIWQNLAYPANIPYLNVRPDGKERCLIVTNKIRGITKVVDHDMYRLEAAQRGRRIIVR